MCIVAGIGIFLYLVHMDVNYNEKHGYVEEDTAGSYIMRLLISLDTAILGMTQPRPFSLEPDWGIVVRSVLSFRLVSAGCLPLPKI